jgi:hypothetical protein
MAPRCVAGASFTFTLPAAEKPDFAFRRSNLTPFDPLELQAA